MGFVVPESVDRQFPVLVVQGLDGVSKVLFCLVFLVVVDPFVCSHIAITLLWLDVFAHDPEAPLTLEWLVLALTQKSLVFPLGLAKVGRSVLSMNIKSDHG